jgi:hypothetical protein
MHRELKLQHALLQQVAQKVGVTEEATADMRRLVEEAPEGAPIATLLRTPPLSMDGTNAELTRGTAEAQEPSSFTNLVEEHEALEKADV